MNTLENRILKQNSIQIRTNRFNNPTFHDEEYYMFDFNDNLKSDNLEDLKFTNYVSSNECKKYLDLKEICSQINSNKNKLDELFINDELDESVSPSKYNRLLQILSLINNRKIDSSEIILKFKNRNDKEIQFYIKNEHGTFKLYMIDMYHLGIEAVNKRTGRADINRHISSKKKV